MMKDIGTSVLEKRELHREGNSILNEIPTYPYEMSITVNPETMEKMGIYFIPQVGQKMALKAYVEVVKVEKEETGPSFRLQIQEADLQPMELTGKLYPEG